MVRLVTSAAARRWRLHQNHGWRNRRDLALLSAFMIGFDWRVRLPIRAMTLPLFAFSLALGAGAAQFKFPEQTFTLPDGFEMERVAGPGLVDRPISADFDEQGRLYVTDSSGSNDKPEKQLEEKPHRIVRLEDT